MTRLPSLTLITTLAIRLLASPGEAVNDTGRSQIGTRSTISSEWARVDAALGDMALDGTFRRRYSIGLGSLSRVGINVALEHRVDADGSEGAYSRWKILGLQTSLTPYGRTMLRWQPLTGGSQYFRRESISPNFSVVGPSKFQIREVEHGSFDILGQDGQTWRYKRGILVSLENPRMGKLRILTQGALITSIESSDGPETQAWFSAQYSEDGKLLRLHILSEGTHVFEWDKTDKLSVWHHANGQETLWEYEGGLLSNIHELGRTFGPIRWRNNIGFGRGDSRWLAPVHLISSNLDRYSYKLSSQGFILNHWQADTGKTIVTIFNPRRGRLEQKSEGGTTVVIFREQAFGLGPPVRIETDTGEILEEDASGLSAPRK